MPLLESTEGVGSDAYSRLTPVGTGSWRLITRDHATAGVPKKSKKRSNRPKRQGGRTSNLNRDKKQHQEQRQPNGVGPSAPTRPGTLSRAWDARQELPTRGLVNLGNTCFFNSTMQNVFKVRLLHQSLFGNTSGRQGDAFVGPLSKAFRKALLEMGAERSTGSRRGAYSPKELLSAVQRVDPIFKGTHQQDAHELFMCLMGTLEDEEVAFINQRLEESNEVKRKEDKCKDIQSDGKGEVEVSSIGAAGSSQASKSVGSSWVHHVHECSSDVPASASDWNAMADVDGGAWASDTDGNKRGMTGNALILEKGSQISSAGTPTSTVEGQEHDAGRSCAVQPVPDSSNETEETGSAGGRGKMGGGFATLGGMGTSTDDGETTDASDHDDDVIVGSSAAPSTDGVTVAAVGDAKRMNPGLPRRAAVTEVFGGLLCSVVTCSTCAARSFSTEPTVCLSLNIAIKSVGKNARQAAERSVAQAAITARAAKTAEAARPPDAEKAASKTNALSLQLSAKKRRKLAREERKRLKFMDAKGKNKGLRESALVGEEIHGRDNDDKRVNAGAKGSEEAVKESLGENDLEDTTQTVDHGCGSLTDVAKRGCRCEDPLGRRVEGKHTCADLTWSNRFLGGAGTSWSAGDEVERDQQAAGAKLDETCKADAGGARVSESSETHGNKCAASETNCGADRPDCGKYLDRVFEGGDDGDSRTDTPTSVTTVSSWQTEISAADAAPRSPSPSCEQPAAGCREGAPGAKGPSSDKTDKSAVSAYEGATTGDEDESAADSSDASDNPVDVKNPLNRLVEPPPRIKKGEGRGELAVDLYECLDHFTAEEALIADNGNGYDCERCKARTISSSPAMIGKNKGIAWETKQDARKRLLMLGKPPGVLVCHLKRLQAKRKITKSVLFDLDLDMSPYFWQDPQAPLTPKEAHYSLFGLVEHRGNRLGGHYVAYIRDKDGWKHASDSAVRPSTLKEVQGCEAYMLFYERCDLNPLTENPGYTESMKANAIVGAAKAMVAPGDEDRDHVEPLTLQMRG